MSEGYVVPATCRSAGPRLDGPARRISAHTGGPAAAAQRSAAGPGPTKRSGDVPELGGANERIIDLGVRSPAAREVVWEAVATGRGVSSWYVSTELEERPGGRRPRASAKARRWSSPVGSRPGSASTRLFDGGRRRRRTAGSGVSLLLDHRPREAASTVGPVDPVTVSVKATSTPDRRGQAREQPRWRAWSRASDRRSPVAIQSARPGRLPPARTARGGTRDAGRHQVQPVVRRRRDRSCRRRGQGGSGRHDEHLRRRRHRDEGDRRHDGRPEALRPRRRELLHQHVPRGSGRRAHGLADLAGRHRAPSGRRLDADDGQSGSWLASETGVDVDTKWGARGRSSSRGCSCCGARGPATCSCRATARSSSASSAPGRC